MGKYNPSLKLAFQIAKIFNRKIEEIFLIDRFVELFKENIVSKDFFDMNYIEYDFSKIDLQKLKIILDFMMILQLVQVVLIFFVM